MISVHFQDKPFSITVIKSTTPNTNAEGAESDWFYKDLQELLELNQKKKKKRCIFHYRELECKIRKPRDTWRYSKVSLALEYKMKQSKG